MPVAFAEMERIVLRQRVLEGVKAARAHGRKGGRLRIMTAEKQRYAQRLMADRTRSVAPSAASSTVKDPGRRLLDA